jgi:hypothetical protein
LLVDGVEDIVVPDDMFMFGDVLGIVGVLLVVLAGVEDMVVFDDIFMVVFDDIFMLGVVLGIVGVLLLVVLEVVAAAPTITSPVIHG